MQLFRNASAPLSRWEAGIVVFYSARDYRGRYRAIHRLVTDVCHVGSDVPAWTNRLMQGLAQLFDAKIVGLAWAHLPDQPGQFNRSEIELHYGFTEEQHRLWNQTYCGDDQTFQSEFLRRVVNIPARFVTIRRQDVMSDAEWYALSEVQTVHRSIGIDATMASFFVVQDLRRLFGIGVHRAWGKPQYTREDRQRLRVLHIELAHAWRRLSRPNEESQAIARLSPRLRQVLWLLCLGRSEKEIAMHLDISPHTVHNHVCRLYHSLSVGSRGELLAKALTHNQIQLLALPAAELNQFKR